MAIRSSNYREFNADLEQWADENDEWVGKVHRALALEAARGVILMTPVDTGRARGGWHAATNLQTASDFMVQAAEAVRLDKSGHATLSAARAEVERTRPYTITSIVNNVRYIGALEDGHSGQAPHGMLELTVQRLSGHFR